MARDVRSAGDSPDEPLPPEEGLRLPWSRSDRPVPRRLIRPLQSFLETEVASGVLLLVVGVGRWGVVDDLGGWIREGLMSLFFLVVCLEIKREIRTGELRDHRVL